MSTTSGVSGTSSDTSSSLTTGINQKLDRDAFLKLLIAEMSNQDPMSPMDNTDYVAQLAQFSSLEQMEQMSEGFDALSQTSTATQAFSLSGKWVDYTDPTDATQTLTSQVEGVVIEDGVPLLKVGSNKIEMSAITKVYSSSTSVGVGQKAQQALQYIGKTVDYYDASGKTTSGKVDSISYSDGWPTLNIGSDSVSVDNIIGIHSGTSSLASGQAEVIANALIGKTVEYIDPSDSSKTLKGEPSTVIMNGNSATLKIGSSVVGLEDIVKVYED